MDTKSLLRAFLGRLLSMGQEVPVYLVTLTQIVQPALTEENRTTVLGCMFKELPMALEQLSAEQVLSLAQNPPLEAVALRLLLDLYQIQTILQGVSSLQLFQLSYHMPPSSPQQQLVNILQLQDRFRCWTEDFLNNLHNHFQTVPVHQEIPTLTGR